MSFCSFTTQGESSFLCSRCGRSVVSSSAPIRQCLVGDHLYRASPSVGTAPGGYRESVWQRFIGKGPGDYLHDAIERKTGEKPITSCQCGSRIRLMNMWGLSECRRRVGEIAGWMAEEGKSRGWAMRLKTMLAEGLAAAGGPDYIARFVDSALDECAATYPKFQAFYHIACMNPPHWQAVVEEQAALFESVGIVPTACVIGTDADVEWIKSKGIVVHSRYDSFSQFETPTLQLMWEWCQKNADGFCMYVHTKGASQPFDDRRKAWRQLMGYYVVGDWMDTIGKLKDADIAGVSWLDRHWHFSGNFFMARADWINQLPSPLDHRYKMRPKGDNGAWDRLGCELWVGAKHDGLRVAHLCAHNRWIASGRLLYRLLDDKIRERENATLPTVAPQPVSVATRLSNPAVVRALMRPNSAIRKRMVG